MNVQKIGDVAAFLRHNGQNSLADALDAALAEPGEAVTWLPDEGAYLIRFDDADRSDELFTGSSARDCALRRYEQISGSWNAHLFVKIDSNSRDVQTPSAHPPAQPASAPSDNDLRAQWRAAGGSFHGPNVETGTMPESKLLPFLRSIAVPQPANVPDEMDTTVTSERDSQFASGWNACRAQILKGGA